MTHTNDGSLDYSRGILPADLDVPVPYVLTERALDELPPTPAELCWHPRSCRMCDTLDGPCGAHYGVGHESCRRTR